MNSYRSFNRLRPSIKRAVFVPLMLAVIAGPGLLQVSFSDDNRLQNRSTSDIEAEREQIKERKGELSPRLNPGWGKLDRAANELTMTVGMEALGLTGIRNTVKGGKVMDSLEGAIMGRDAVELAKGHVNWQEISDPVERWIARNEHGFRTAVGLGSASGHPWGKAAGIALAIGDYVKAAIETCVDHAFAGRANREHEKLQQRDTELAEELLGRRTRDAQEESIKAENARAAEERKKWDDPQTKKALDEQRRREARGSASEEPRQREAQEKEFERSRQAIQKLFEEPPQRPDPQRTRGNRGHRGPGPGGIQVLPEHRIPGDNTMPLQRSPDF